MEYWRQCSVWLIDCRVLPPTHRVRTDWAQVFDLAQTLRDGVLLCQLLNNLRANTINLKEINLRPQMSQFLCLKNIRTFLSSCCEAFGMKKSELFDAFDLFDVRDFGKCVCVCVCYSEQVLEDIYDPVYGDVEGGEIYEDLMRTEAAQKQAEVDVRSCCLSEINQTEEKYTETLESIEKYFLIPLKKFMSTAELDKVFINIPDLVRAHQSLMMDIKESIQNKNASNLHQIFTNYKDRLLIYGIYCSQVETAIAMLDFLCKEKQDIRLKLEECSKRANNGKFTLRDLLVVPMQRVLKYPLLLQELVKHTPDSSEKNNLRTALDAMRDLAQYVNEVKRDNETLREIDQYQRSIENLNQCLLRYGRPKGDGEVRLATNVDKRRQDRHIFLFDAAVIVCKRRGDNYEMKDVIDLSLYKITNNPTTDKDCRKWCYGFYLTHEQGTSGFEFFFKTKELKKKWLDQFQMALSNIRPENATYNSHHFRMHTFEWVTTCSSCHMLLRGIFNQGYLCPKCGVGAHKECLGRLGACGRAGKKKQCLPRMLVIRDYLGAPSPPGGPPLSVQVGDVIEVISANLDSCWWQGKIPTTREVGFFPSDAVRPCPCVSTHAYSVVWAFFYRFAGLMERHHAEAALMERENSTYLIRHRSRECSEYAISIKYNNEVKHIKILTRDGCFYIAESRTFKTVQGLVEYYKHHSLREGFRSLDTTLKVPYRIRVPVNTAIHSNSHLFCPRVVGIALARYDFSSRDTRELSLHVGDLVKIYTKCANGWWRGEVNSRVGWFPSTYVEEEE
uniref:Vav 3 guanine nucleotide exchange factor b n=1 Tax=Pygocentrus nattereri TaxID=42514 RepID=A0AAR2KVP9_PYGNA